MGELGRLARGYGEVMFGEDFDAPVPGNAQERQDAKNEALGLPLDEARTLTAASMQTSPLTPGDTSS